MESEAYVEVGTAERHPRLGDPLDWRVAGVSNDAISCSLSIVIGAVLELWPFKSEKSLAMLL